LVVGEPVTEEQANEILIRTMPYSLFTNDKDWERQVCEVLGVGREPKYGMPSHDSLKAARESLRCLDLHYLENWRIASSWIGGPYGWCDWDGTIGCANYNIGKWPSVEAVTEDWLTIAAAWPFLDLRAQLVPDEGEADEPAVEWLVRGGSVTTMTGPAGLLRRPEEPFVFSVLIRGGERGVAIDRLRAAVAQVQGGGSA
jgi:hypothetical protein